MELKEEILQNLIDKYHDLLAEGKSPEAAFNISVASVGDVDELLSSLTAGYNPNPFPDEESHKNRSANPPSCSPQPLCFISHVWSLSSLRTV